MLLRGPVVAKYIGPASRYEPHGARQPATRDLTPLFDPLLVVIVLAAAGIALPAGRLPMMLVTAILTAIVAIHFAAGFPNRVRQHLHYLDWRHGIIALDYQFAMAAALFIGAVLNHHRQA